MLQRSSSRKTYSSATQKTCYGTFRTLIFHIIAYFSKFCSSNFYFRFNANENYQISEIEQKQDCLNKILLAVANTKKVEQSLSQLEKKLLIHILFIRMVQKSLHEINNPHPCYYQMNLQIQAAKYLGSILICKAAREFYLKQ